MEELSFSPGMFSHVTRRSVIPARNRNRRNPKQTNAFQTMQLLSVLQMLNDLGFISDYSNLAKNHRCVFCKICLLPACQPAFVMGGADLGAQAGTYLVRFSTRTKIWPTKKTGRMIHILRPLACAAALTQQVKLSLGSTQALYNLYNLVESEVEDVGVNCGGGAAVYQSFCWRVAANMRCDQVQEVASIISHCPFQPPK